MNLIMHPLKQISGKNTDQHIYIYTIIMYDSEAAEKLVRVDQCSINGHTSQQNGKERGLWYGQSARTALQPDLIAS